MPGEMKKRLTSRVIGVVCLLLFHHTGVATGENLKLTGDNRLVVTSQGNVGIGTDTPAHSLSVNGAITAKEMVVDVSGWADHVLSPEYHLLPLSDLKSYIEIKGHLPGVLPESAILSGFIAKAGG